MKSSKKKNPRMMQLKSFMFLMMIPNMKMKIMLEANNNNPKQTIRSNY